MYYVGNIPCTPSDIQHFGIKGMKWGIRRYQNPDGTLTAAGRARYGYNPGESIRQSKKSLKGAEKHYNQLNIRRNATRFESTRLLSKSVGNMEKAERMDARGKTKARDKYANKAQKQLQRSNELKAKVSDLEKMMQSTEAEQWKHIANLAANGVSVTKIERTKFVMDGRASAAAFLAGAPGILAYTVATKGQAPGDYINTNKYKFGKGGNVNMVNKTNPRLQSFGLDAASDAELRRLQERAKRHV